MRTLPRIVFLGTPDFAGDLLLDIQANHLAQILGVWTKPSLPRGRGKKVWDSKIVRLCREQGISLFQTSKINQPQQVAHLRALGVDLALIVAYGQIIKADFFGLPTYGSFNLHFSLLPKYRGASPIQSALLNGETHSGLTLQKINEKMDEGDIVLQRSFDIEGLHQKALFEKSTEEAKCLLRDFFSAFPDCLKHLRRQDPSQATYCKKIDKHSGRIGRDTCVLELTRKLRAFYPWPGTFFYLEGKRFEILAIKEAQPTKAAPGTLVRTGKKELWLTLTDGSVALTKIKREGKKALDIVSFLNGTKLAFPLRIDQD